MVSLAVATTTKTSGRRRSREQRRRDREREREVVHASTSDTTTSAEPDELPQAEHADQPETATSDIVSVEATPVESGGVMQRLFGSGQPRVVGGENVAFANQPGLFRPIARRQYQRELAMQSIKHGFDDLSGLMADIRDGLDDSVQRQGELLDALKVLPVLAEQNGKSAERFEEQFRRNNDQLARSNELAGENLKVQNDNLKIQAEALKNQADSVRALRDQISNQREQDDRLGTILGGMGKESRDQKRDVEELQGRLERMRQSDQSIADNLGSVAGAIKRVSEQASTQNEVIVKLQSAMDERTRRLEGEVARRGRMTSWLLGLTLLLTTLALAGLATAAFLYLRHTGAV
jgi:chromosome segregation ATPase